MGPMYQDPRMLAPAAKPALEQETLDRLNPYGPARPPTGLEPPNWRQRMRQFWSRLRAWWPLGRKREDGAPEN